MEQQPQGAGGDSDTEAPPLELAIGGQGRSQVEVEEGRAAGLEQEVRRAGSQVPSFSPGPGPSGLY